MPAGAIDREECLGIAASGLCPRAGPGQFPVELRSILLFVRGRGSARRVTLWHALLDRTSGNNFFGGSYSHFDK